VDIFPGAEFKRRRKGQGFEIGRIAGWAAKRGYTNLMVVNEDRKKPSELIYILFMRVGADFFFLSRCDYACTFA